MSYRKTVIDSLARQLNELDEAISQMQEDYDKAAFSHPFTKKIADYMIMLSGVIHEKQAERSVIKHSYNDLVHLEFE